MFTRTQLVDDSYAQSFQHSKYNYELISYLRDSQRTEVFSEITRNFDPQYHETKISVPAVHGFSIIRVQSLICVILSVACIAVMLCVNAKYRAGSLIKILLLLMQVGVICVHVVQMCVCNNYNADNKKLLDEYLKFTSDQETLASLFRDETDILKFITCDENIKTNFRDMYCLGFNYQVGQLSSRYLIDKHMGEYVAYCNYSSDASEILSRHLQ